MPKRKDGPVDSETIKVRLPTWLIEQCKELRLAGTHKDEPETVFLGYLIKLGAIKYEKVILPLENCDEEESAITQDNAFKKVSG
ncbi:hypothetical protein Holit_01756 [Hollandina sp. SP2]